MIKKSKYLIGLTLIIILLGCNKQDLKSNLKSFIDIDDTILSETEPKRLAILDQGINESSGLLYVEGKLYTHNDSSSKAQILEIDLSGKIVRTITILGATNIDWESMTQDELYIYIADIGNNNGDRKDLKIYKINKVDFLSKDYVDSKIIEIQYADQNIFEYDTFFTPYDAEAIIAYQNKLYIFTKNWKDKTTTIYSVSKNPGRYTLDSISSHTYDFLITDASYHKQANKIILIGYSSFLMITQKISILENFVEDDFFSGDIREIEISSDIIGFKQIEAVTHNNSKKIYITSETVTNKYIGNHPASLFELKIFE